MIVEGGGSGNIPAGYTYLGQFIDHDLTMDRTTVMLGEDVRPVDMLQGRSPRLDLDSLYGNGPGDARAPPSSTRPTGSTSRPGRRSRSRPTAPRPGTTCRVSGTGASKKAKRVGPDRRPAQRREPHRRADPSRDDPLPQPGARQAAGVASRTRSVHQGAQEGEPPLPVADPPRLPAADLQPVGAQRRVHQRPQARRAGRARRTPCRRCRSSSRWRPSGSATAWSGRPTTGTGSSRAAAGCWTTCSRSPAWAANLGGQIRLITSWVADFRRMYDFGAGGHPGLVPASNVNRARRIDTRLTDPLGHLPPSTFGGAGLDPVRRPAPQPRVPQPDPRRDGEAGERPADGHQAQQPRGRRHAADQGPDHRRQRRRDPRPAHGGREGRAWPPTRRCGSTSCARRS